MPDLSTIHTDTDPTSSSTSSIMNSASISCDDSQSIGTSPSPSPSTSTWLSNNPIHIPVFKPITTDQSPTSPKTTATTSPTRHPTSNSLAIEHMTVPGGPSSSLLFYKSVLQRRIAQIESGRHAAHVYSSLHDSDPDICYGPPFVSPGKGFEETHVEFHDVMARRKSSVCGRGRDAFCAVCGLRLDVKGTKEGGGAEERFGKKSGSEMGESSRKLVTAMATAKAKVEVNEDDDNASVDSDSREFRMAESGR